MEEGVIRVYNSGDKLVTKVINGVRITIPGKGSAEVSARKGHLLLAEFPQLTEDSAFASRQYTPEQMETAELLDEESLRQCVRVLMAGHRPDLDKALAETSARAAAAEKG